MLEFIIWLIIPIVLGVIYFLFPKYPQLVQHDILIGDMCVSYEAVKSKNIKVIAHHISFGIYAVQNVLF